MSKALISQEAMVRLWGVVSELRMKGHDRRSFSEASRVLEGVMAGFVVHDFLLLPESRSNPLISEGAVQEVLARLDDDLHSEILSIYRSVLQTKAYFASRCAILETEIEELREKLGIPE